MKKSEQRRKRQQDAERQQVYQKRLRSEGKSQFKITLGKEATEQLEFFMAQAPGKTKSQVMESLVGIAYRATMELQEAYDRADEEGD